MGGVVAVAAVTLGVVALQALVPEPSGHPSSVFRPPGATGAPTASPSATALRAPLTVLNNSRITGLAARAAARFEAGGWTVAEVGNYGGRVAQTTVYFAPGQEAIAQALRNQFPEIRATAARFPALPGTGLTVVVTRDFDTR